MAFSSGTYSLPGAALNTGDTVSATENNTFRNDVATAFNLTWLRNGTATATANLPMGGYKLTGLGDGSASGNALVYGQTTDAVLSGNLGLGVTPSAWDTFKALDVNTFGSLFASTGSVQLSGNLYYASGAYKYKTTAAASIYVQTAGQHQWYNAPSGTAGTSATVTQAMTLDASGNLGVGTTGTGNKFVVSNAGASGLEINPTLRDGTSAGSFLLSYNRSGAAYVPMEIDAADIRFKTSNTERARIDSSGNLLVGATSNAAEATRLYVVADGTHGAAEFSVPSTASYTQIFFRNPNGIVGSITTAASSTTYATSSDYRLKNTVEPMTGALAKVAALKPVTYKWNSDGSDGEGFIAHELAEVCPHAVVGEKDATRIEQYEISSAVEATFDEEGNELTPAVEAVMGEREVPVYQGIDTSFLVATLTAAIQEMKSIIDDQAARIVVLEAK